VDKLAIAAPIPTQQAVKYFSKLLPEYGDNQDSLHQKGSYAGMLKGTILGLALISPP
jgi:hypothetical protein